MNRHIIVVTALIGLLISSLANAQTDTIKSVHHSGDTTMLALKVTGMHCQAGCANGIDSMLKEQKGIFKSTTTFDTESSTIWYDKTIIKEDQIIAFIEERGFQTKKVEKQEKNE